MSVSLLNSTGAASSGRLRKINAHPQHWIILNGCAPALPARARATSSALRRVLLKDITLTTAFAKQAGVVAQNLSVDTDNGLDDREVVLRRRRYGANQLRARAKQSIFVLLAHQFRGVIVWLLAVAAGLSFFFGDIVEGVAVILVLVINAVIGFVTELRAARSMEALLKISHTTTRVRRGGRVVRIDAHDLVPGDVVVLDAGNMITADMRLIAGSNLQCDESVLTGESLPVFKQTDPVAPDALIGDRSCMVFKGTAIVQGSGVGIVTATGMKTELGHISDLVQTAQSSVSPLTKRLDHLGHRLVWLTLVLAILVVVAGAWRGLEMALIIQTGVVLAVATVPEGLPVVATLCLARGMWRMAARNAIISNLSSVETLGATTVILTDKTGTLTENSMTVAGYLASDARIALHRQNEFVQFKIADHIIDPAQDSRLEALLRIGALCNGASLEQGDATPSGDPMELALLQAAKQVGRGRQSLLATYEKVAEYAFDQDTKMMATVHVDGDKFLYAIKGAPEAVMEVCSHALGAEGPVEIGTATRAEWLDRSGVAAREGQRLLAIAMKRSDQEDVSPYEDLMLVGMVCLRDPLREDAAPAIAAARAAGVRVVMMTGDHADTAAAIAAQAGLGRQGHDLIVIEGRELNGFDPETIDDTLRDRILSADVFARVAPATKLNIAALYQNSGHVVAMTGDGVNDAPALKKADIGIAMGQRGTEVAREAAHMVLKDDSFGTIIAAMRQGRVIFDNIRKFVVYLMSCNVSEVMIVGLAVGAGLPMPLLPLQILFLNLVTDIFPAFALGFGKGDEAIMHQPPRDPSESIIDRRLWMTIGFLGGTITVATLGAFWVALQWLKLDSGPAVTVSFLTLALAQLWNVFNVRMSGGRVFVNEVTGNLWVWGAIALCLILISAALWVPALSDILKLPDPGLHGLLLAASASLAPLVISQCFIIFTAPQDVRLGNA